MKDTNLNTKEEWKQIKEFPDYEVSTFGRVRKGDLILKTSLTTNGYPRVHLRKDKKDHTLMVHRFVAKAFIPNPNNYPVVNHIDGNKTNNNVKNLEWCTSLMNLHHAYKTGLMRDPNVLTPEQAKELKMMYKRGATRKELEKKFKISKGSVGNYLKGIYKKQPVSQLIQYQIRQLYKTNLYTVKELCFLFDLKDKTVRDILKRKSRI